MQKTFTFLKQGVLCLLVLFLINKPFTTHANHEVSHAVEMYYNHIGSDSILVTVNAYLGCISLDPSNLVVEINVAPEKSKAFKVTAKYINSSAITSFLKKGQCSKCTNSNCALNIGTARYVYQAVIDLSAYNDCSFRFSNTTFKRATGSSTLEDVYVTAYMDRCKNGYVNAPQFGYDPVSYLCINECMYKMHSAVGNAGDSLVYSLISPRISSSSNHSYPTGYDYTKPLSVATSGCSGFNLNTATGQLIFKPTIQTESYMAVLVEQYHEDTTGKMVKIGEIMREVTLTVLNCNSNNAPVLSAGSSDQRNYYVCAGNQVSISFNTMDADPKDTVNISYMMNMKNASFSATTNSLWNNGTFYWKPQKSDIQKSPHQLMLAAYDDKGPIPGRAEKVYNIYVIGERPQVSIKTDVKTCGEIAFEATGQDTSTITRYGWNINGWGATGRQISFQTKKNGKYYIKLVVLNKAGCEATYIDSVEISNLPEISLGKDFTLCKGSKAQLNPNANTAYKYKWQANSTLSSDTVASPEIQPLTDQEYIVEVTDKSGCKITDTLKVFVPHIFFTLSNDTTVCSNRPVTLRINGPKKLKYTWSPSSGMANPNDTIVTIYPQKTTIYKVTAQNENGCDYTDSLTVTIASSQAYAGEDKSVCLGDSVLLQGSGGYYYNWVNANGHAVSNKQSVYLKPLQTTEYTLYVQDSLKCSVSFDKINVKINQITTAISSDVTICPGDTTLLSATGGNAYIWLPKNGLSATNLASVYANPLTTTTYYAQITDTLTGCSQVKEVKVTVSTDCVWPGDANKDGIVNYKDALFIGVGYSAAGTARTNASIRWRAQVAEDWNISATGNINYKHIDTDGDGKIAQPDIYALHDNYGFTIPGYKAIPFVNPSSGTPLYFLLEKDTFYAGDTVTAQIILGNENNQLSEIYGLGLKYALHSNVLVDSSLKNNPDKTFFAPNSSDKLIFLHHYSLAEKGLAIAKTNNMNSSGYGEVSRIQFILKDSTYNYSATGEKLAMRITEALAIDKTGKSIQIKVSGDSAIVMRKKKVDEHIGFGEQDVFGHLKIFPNPAQNQFTISGDKILNGEIIISNMLGQQIITRKLQNQKEITINTKHFTAGIYMVQIQNGNQRTTRKLIIAK